MSDTQLRLFDVTDYGGEEPTRAEAPKAKQRVELPVERWIEPWVLIRGKQGVFPYFHLERSRNLFGAVSTACGLLGTRITNEGVGMMIRCPECDLGAQLA